MMDIMGIRETLKKRRQNKIQQEFLKFDGTPAQFNEFQVARGNQPLTGSEIQALQDMYIKKVTIKGMQRQFEQSKIPISTLYGETGTKYQMQPGEQGPMLPSMFGKLGGITKETMQSTGAKFSDILNLLPKPSKPTTELGKHYGEFDSLSPDDPRRLIYAQKIQGMINDNPSTAWEAFLNRNPNPSNEELINFNNAMKGKTSLRVLPDGTVEYSQGGIGLTPSAESEIEKTTGSLLDQLNQLKKLGTGAFTDALTMQGKTKAKVLRLADSIKIPIGEGGKEYLGKSRTFVENLEKFFNAYRKEITGAQAAIQELELLRDSILNRKLTPSEFEASWQNAVDTLTERINLLEELKTQGISKSNINKRLDDAAGSLQTSRFNIISVTEN